MALCIDSLAREFACKPPGGHLTMIWLAEKQQISWKTTALRRLRAACDQTQRNLQVELAGHRQLLKLRKAMLSEVLFGKQVGVLPALSIPGKTIKQPLLSQGAHQFALLSPLFTWFLRNFPQRQKGFMSEILAKQTTYKCQKKMNI